MRDAVATMGAILTDDIEGRDAVHVAVIAAVAAEDLVPGQDVGKDGGVANPVGIVDPFLREPVKEGQRFWLFLYPRTITSLKHSWTHPAFGDDVRPTISEQNIEASEQWLRDFIARSDCPSYEVLIAAAVGDHHKNLDPQYDADYFYSALEKWDSDNTYLHFGGRDAHGEIPPEFWDHVEVVTGRKIPRDKRATYFSCSC